MINRNNPIGKQIGNYQITDVLGIGLMGIVYKVVPIQASHGPVALKLLREAHLDSQEKQETFLKEAKILKPGIAEIRAKAATAQP